MDPKRLSGGLPRYRALHSMVSGLMDMYKRDDQYAGAVFCIGFHMAWSGR